MGRARAPGRRALGWLGRISAIRARRHLVPRAAGGGEVAAGARPRGGVDAGRVQLARAQARGERRAPRARAAAQVDDDGPRPVANRLAMTRTFPTLFREDGGRADEGHGLADEELGPAAGHEDAGVHGYPQAAELRPADDMLEWQAARAPGPHPRQGGPGPCRRAEQPRLLLARDTARRAEL